MNLIMALEKEQYELLKRDFPFTFLWEKLILPNSKYFLLYNTQAHILNRIFNGKV